MTDHELSTTSGEPVELVRERQKQETAGQHSAYIVLSADERAKGFVRAYRDSYKHVGARPRYPVRPLTDDEKQRYAHLNYTCFEAYPPESPEAQGGAVGGRFWTDARLKSGCGTVTVMGRAIAETYARDPKFYGATFCVGCNAHFPVEEFVWDADGARVGS